MSPGGVPWHIEANRTRAGAYVELGYDPPGNPGVGWAARLVLPAPRVFLAAGWNFGISPYPEDDVGGVTSSRIRKVVARMTNGSHLSFKPGKAPKTLRSTRPWLRRLRFFDVFYSSGVHPKALEAYDANGHLLRTYHPRGGLFG